jgi:PAS domain S-box-containing protein
MDTPPACVPKSAGAPMPERNLDDASARLQSLIDTANNAVVTIDEQSQIIDWNNAAERIFGWPRIEAMGRSLTELIIPRRTARTTAGLARYLKDGRRRCSTGGWSTLAPQWRRVRRRTVGLAGARRDHTTFSSFIRDISRARRPSGFWPSPRPSTAPWWTTERGHPRHRRWAHPVANPRALELTGVDEATPRRPFIDFIHPTTARWCWTTALLRSETLENRYQFRVQKPGGEIVWLEISAVLFEWQNAPATLNFLIDVTLRRQIEDDIRQALQRERELSELKSRFVAVASHEFRTPLSAILSSVELLDDYGDRLPPSERKEMLTLIKTAVSRMNDMVDQVLLTSRLDAGSFGFSPKPHACRTCWCRSPPRWTGRTRRPCALPWPATMPTRPAWSTRSCCGTSWSTC